jgi:hypothetical protein
VAALDQLVDEHAVTLVAAAAGAGKTVLLALALILAGSIDEAGRWLAHLDTLEPASPSPRFAARHELAKATWLANRGEIEAGVAQIEDAMQELAHGADPFEALVPAVLIRGYEYLDRPADARAASTCPVRRASPVRSPTRARMSPARWKPGCVASPPSPPWRPWNGRSRRRAPDRRRSSAWPRPTRSV